jgi:hypothetical protein
MKKPFIQAPPKSAEYPQQVKRFIRTFCLLLVMLVFLSGCSSLQKSPYPAKIEAVPDLRLIIDPADYKTTAAQINFALYNDSADEAIYGAAYALEVFKNGNWYTVPFIGIDRKAQPTWPMIAYTLPAHGSAQGLVVDLSRHEAVGPGQYRLIKEVSLRLGNRTAFNLAAEFTIK